ncbi:MAG: tetratricopeptide repeat protein [Candidatus Riflebacteria bacterium]|nr:tetratricopeptide repeat protein [Candidatus Riflebacteria bacterium]
MRRALFPALLLVCQLTTAGLAAPAAGLPAAGAPAADTLLPMPPAPTATAEPAAVNEAARLLAAGRSLEAEQALQLAVKAHPQSAEAFYNLGLAQSFNGRHQEALASFRQALALRADFPEASLGLGTVLLTLGQPEPALAAFETALARTPDSPTGRAALFNKGTALGRLQRYTEAELALSEALAADPDDPSPAFQIGKLKMQQQKWEDALGWLETTATAFPLETHLLSGKAYLKLRNRAAAERSLIQAAACLATAGLAADTQARLTREIDSLRQEAARLGDH